MRLTFTIQRFNPETDQHPHQEDHRLDIGRGTTVLEGPIRIKNELTAVWRCAIPAALRSAAPAPCRSTARRNWPVAPLSAKNWSVTAKSRSSPRRIFRIKDLVVDMAPFWEKIRARDTLADAGHPSHQTLRAIGATAVAAGDLPVSQRRCCIMCGLRGRLYPHEVSKGFLGPAALAKAARFVADPREPSDAKTGPAQRSRKTTGSGIVPAATCACRSVPKTSNRWRRIIRLRRSSLRHGLTTAEGARHITGFVDLVRKEGRLNEALMPLKVVGINRTRVARHAAGPAYVFQGQSSAALSATRSRDRASPAIFRRAPPRRSRLTPMPGTFRFLDDIAIADMAFDMALAAELFEAATDAPHSLADPAPSRNAHLAPHRRSVRAGCRHAVVRVGWDDWYLAMRKAWCFIRPHWQLTQEAGRFLPGIFTQT